MLPVCVTIIYKEFNINSKVHYLHPIYDLQFLFPPNRLFFFIKTHLNLLLKWILSDNVLM